MSNRRNRGEGKDMGGTTIRSRFDRSEMQKRVMEAGSDPNFRNRPEIAHMRSRAEKYKAAHRTGYQSPEMLAERLRKKRGE